MNHWYTSMGTGDWLVMSLFWVALIGALVWAIVRVAQPNRSHSDLRSERPDEILDRRLAAGEIDSATYDTLGEKLHAH
jgi:putative membrane protein